MGLSSSRDQSRRPFRRRSAPDLIERIPPQSSPSSSIDQQQKSTEDETLVPTVFTWNYGGYSVYVAGAWDNWKSETPMYKNGNEYIALVYIPIGEHQFKFFIDDVWQCAPNMPTRTDEHGNTNNVITVEPKELEFDSNTPLHAGSPPSPLSSYNQSAIPEFSADPPTLPPHLESRVLKPLPDDISPSVRAMKQSAPHDGTPGETRKARPFISHVYIDHLYQEKGAGDDDVHSLSQTTRVGRKVINTVFVTIQGNHKSTGADGNGFAHVGELER